MTQNYLWDKNKTRYRQAKQSGGQSFNLLALSGGPGMDSSYMQSCIDILNVPGNCWLIDFPGNGSNHPEFTDCDQWFSYLIDTVKMFPNPIILGHSFGGIISLLSPQLEKHLKGLIMLNATPTNWVKASEEVRKKKNLPDMERLKPNPSNETMKAFFLSSAPYFFLPDKLEQGEKMLSSLPFNIHTLNWFHSRVQREGYEASWIPQNVPTLILSGSEDVITPPKLFRDDPRFDRPNIQHMTLDGASHFCWYDKPEQVSSHIGQFFSSLTGL